jgi:acylphosphatase
MSGPVVHRLRVSGRVQGVGFRWFVREQARALDLAGWVRNEPDGTVVLEVSGTPEAVAALRDAVRVGPAGARVQAVQSDEAPESQATDLPRPFAVQR